MEEYAMRAWTLFGPLVDDQYRRHYLDDEQERKARFEFVQILLNPHIPVPFALREQLAAALIPTPDPELREYPVVMVGGQPVPVRVAERELRFHFRGKEGNPQKRQPIQDSVVADFVYHVRSQLGDTDEAIKRTARRFRMKVDRVHGIWNRLQRTVELQYSAPTK
jgi:hypothetical protein